MAKSSMLEEFSIFVSLCETGSKSIDELFDPAKSACLELCLDCLNKESAIYGSCGPIVTALECIDRLLATLLDTKLNDAQRRICEEIGNRLLKQHYDGHWADPAVPGNVESARHSMLLLQKLIVIYPAYVKQTHASELIGLCKAFWRFGIEQPASADLRKAQISPHLFYDPAAEVEFEGNGQYKNTKTRTLRMVSKNKRLQAAVPADLRLFEMLNEKLNLRSSDSELSENDTILSNSHERHHAVKVRQAAITLLETVALSMERGHLYGYWHTIFPCSDDNKQRKATPGLLDIATTDPNVRCRCSALQLAAQLIHESKKFLAIAENINKMHWIAFVPLTTTLSICISSMYESLATILAQEAALSVLILALKCLAILVQATPFHKLRAGFVTKCFAHVKEFAQHRDCNIQVSAFIVLEFLVATPVLTDELSQLLGLGSGELAAGDAAQPPKANWLLACVMKNIAASPTPLRLECLQVLGAMSAHFDFFDGQLLAIAEILQTMLNEGQPEVRLYAGRCMRLIGMELPFHLHGNSSSLIEKECLAFWRRLLQIIYENFNAIKEHEPAGLKVLICDTIATLPEPVFEHLTPGEQKTAVVFLLGIGSDDSENNDADIRSSAIRGLALFVLFPSLSRDLVYIEQAIELTLALAEHTNVSVRVKIMWSLGNITRYLANNCNDNNSERLSEDLIQRLITVASAAVKDVDKVRINATRTLGNLLRVITVEQLQSDQEVLQLAQLAIERLIWCVSSAGTAKVKWNACYSIGSFLQNSAFFQLPSGAELAWQNALYPVLCHVIVQHTNFKVRTQAAAAVLSIGQRAHFGDHFERFCAAVLAALEQSCNLDNYQEYNHRDNLQEQLCLVLANIFDKANVSDLPALSGKFARRAELVVGIWQRVCMRLVPERTTKMLLAIERLRNLLKDESSVLNTDERSALKSILHAFNNES